MPDLAIPVWDVLARLGLAVVAGGLLGGERESRGKPAGFRTMMMVALGAAIFTLVGVQLYHDAVRAGVAGGVDHIRVIQGVAGGIGFLGAGTIIRGRGGVEGITTAATIWVVGAVGVACGVGAYGLVGTGVLLALLILVVMKAVERHLLPGRR